MVGLLGYAAAGLVEGAAQGVADRAAAMREQKRDQLRYNRQLELANIQNQYAIDRANTDYGRRMREAAIQATLRGEVAAGQALANEGGGAPLPDSVIARGVEKQEIENARAIYPDKQQFGVYMQARGEAGQLRDANVNQFALEAAGPPRKRPDPQAWSRELQNQTRIQNMAENYADSRPDSWETTIDPITGKQSRVRTEAWYRNYDAQLNALGGQRYAPQSTGGLMPPQQGQDQASQFGVLAKPMPENPDYSKLTPEQNQTLASLEAALGSGMPLRTAVRRFEAEGGDRSWVDAAHKRLMAEQRGSDTGADLPAAEAGDDASQPPGPDADINRLDESQLSILRRAVAGMSERGRMPAASRQATDAFLTRNNINPAWLDLFMRE